MHDATAIDGIHHLTAIASSAQENLAFYEQTLGLRLVKQTVNFDDPYTHHLYYGDATGSPGTLLTFFPWGHLPPGRPGAGMITAVAMAVAPGSLDYWQRRLAAAGRPVHRDMRLDEPVLSFSDPHGLPLELIAVDHPPAVGAWRESTVPRDHAVLGLHSATATLHDIDAIKALLEETMGLAVLGREGRRWRFVTADPDAPGHVYDVLVDPDAPAGRPGGGTVHHIAFRTPSDRTQSLWQARLRQSGRDVTAVRDRNYFRSIYFHSPGGVLFEIATDPPGFGIDEPLDALGASLKLPKQYEPIRAEIEMRLPPLSADLPPEPKRRIAP